VINRTQGLVVGFVVLAELVLVMILAVDPEIYDSTLREPAGAGVAPAMLLVAALTVFLAVLVTGVIRKWRWTFWLVTMAFLAGALRIPAAALQLTGVLPSTGPRWYEILQALIGVVQAAIGVLMLSGHRRSGVWGRF